MITVALMAGVFFGSYPLQQIDSKNTPFEYGLYDGVSRVAWAIGICYTIFACVHGSGGPINWFLSLPFWQPLARVSYAIFLVHLPVMTFIMGGTKSSLYMDEISTFHTFAGNAVFSIIVSILASLTLESPLITIEKLMIPTKKEKPETITEKEKVKVKAQDINNGPTKFDFLVKLFNSKL